MIHNGRRDEYVYLNGKWKVRIVKRMRKNSFRPYPHENRGIFYIVQRLDERGRPFRPDRKEHAQAKYLTRARMEA